MSSLQDLLRNHRLTSEGLVYISTNRCDDENEEDEDEENEDEKMEEDEEDDENEEEAQEEEVSI
jgi:hypothetical protein